MSTKARRVSLLDSVFLYGVALNVTFKGYADTLNFGFVGDRDTVPHLQRLAVHTGEALRELCDALGVDGAEGPGR